MATEWAGTVLLILLAVTFIAVRDRRREPHVVNALAAAFFALTFGLVCVRLLREPFHVLSPPEAGRWAGALYGAILFSSVIFLWRSRWS
jgi:tellurite resistance protein TehA-like permease